MFDKHLLLCLLQCFATFSLNNPNIELTNPVVQNICDQKITLEGIMFYKPHLFSLDYVIVHMCLFQTCW